VVFRIDREHDHGPVARHLEEDYALGAPKIRLGQAREFRPQAWYVSAENFGGRALGERHLEPGRAL